jgi:hypothetical protein
MLVHLGRRLSARRAEIGRLDRVFGKLCLRKIERHFGLLFPVTGMQAVIPSKVDFAP